VKSRIIIVTLFCTSYVEVDNIKKTSVNLKIGEGIFISATEIICDISKPKKI
jgi:hypothetical protein